MQSFPMFIRTTGRRIVIAGGGEQAAQKARLMTKTDGVLVIAATELEPELAAMVSTGRAEHHAGPMTARLFEGAAMAFVATGCPGIDACLHALAQIARCPVNVVDQPALCDLTTPSIVDRDPVVVAIGTEGTAPVLARRIKTRIERMLPPTIGGLAAFAGRMRAAVSARVPREDRRAFWRWVFSGDPWAAWTRGAEREAARVVKAAIEQGRAPEEPAAGSIAYVGAGPGAPDLLTMRAVARLQEADVIFYDRLVDPRVLELARRDAERIFVGKVVGAHAWPQASIDAAVVAQARRGRRVVRLKSGDPGIFGRLDEELAAAHAAGIATEIVPGVTAACAVAASLGRALTSRGATDTLVLATARRRGDGANVDVSRLAKRGTELAIYMGVSAAAEISAHLVKNGLPPDTRVEVVSEASKQRETALRTTVGRMAGAIREAGISGCALILVTNPTTGEASALRAAS